MLEVVIVCGIGKNGRMSWLQFSSVCFSRSGLRKNFLFLVRSFNVQRASVRYTYIQRTAIRTPNMPWLWAVPELDC